MVDIDINQLGPILEAAGLNGDKLVKTLKQVEDGALSAAKSIGTITFNKAFSSLQDYTKELSNLKLKNIDLKNSNDDISKSISLMSDAMSTFLTLTTGFNAFNSLMVDNGKAVRSMGDDLNLMFQRFGGWENASKKLVGAGLGSLVDAIEKGGSKMIEAASNGQKLESAFLNLQGAGGNLGKMFDGDGKLVSTFADQTERFRATLLSTSQATGESLEDISKYTMELGKIPNAMTASIKIGGGYDDNLHSITGALALATGAQRQFKDVLDAMQVAYAKLGNPQGKVIDSTQKGAEMFALMSAAQQKLGVEFEDTQGYLKHVADQFSLIGDNTQGATNILMSFTGALENTCLTAKASIGVITNMVDSMKNLEMGTKALISARSGGPGGLQGAFQVENLLRKGKVDDVAKMMEQSLRKQFGGRIYTQEEAGNSQQAASGFMRQRSFLRSGAFGSLAKDDDSASRILEALKHGSLTGETLKKEDALKGVTGMGQEIQKKSFDALKYANNKLDEISTIEQQQLLISMRDVLGTGDPKGELAQFLVSQSSKANQDLNDQYSTDEAYGAEYQQKSRKLDSFSGLINVGGLTGENVGKAVTDKLGSITTNAVEAAKGIQSHMRNQRTVKAIEADQESTHKAVNRGNAMKTAMRQMPTTLASHMPQAIAVTKHEVSVKPLEVNITVTRDPGTVVSTTTSSANTTVKDVVNQASNGFLNKGL